MATFVAITVSSPHPGGLPGFKPDISQQVADQRNKVSCWYCFSA